MHHLRGCHWRTDALGDELTELSFGRKVLEGSDLKAFCKILKNSNLQRLHIHDNLITDEGIAELARVIPLCNLAFLSITYCFGKNGYIDYSKLEALKCVVSGKVLLDLGRGG